MQFDGKKLLEETLQKAGFGSSMEAIASMTVFAHPKTVAATENRNVFRIIRGNSRDRGRIETYPDKLGRVMICDNTAPDDAFKWSAPDLKLGKDVQCNHIYSSSKDVEIYTSLANLCQTPSFLAKLTDADESIKSLLKYRVYELYGFVPKNSPPPSKPPEYHALESKWLPFPNPVEDLESLLRKRLMRCSKRRSAISAREIGWLFSGFEPDAILSAG